MTTLLKYDIIIYSLKITKLKYIKMEQKETDNYDDIKKIAVEALKNINPQLPYGRELFDEILRLTIGVALEAVILRNTPHGKEVFLTKRPIGEVFGGLWHCPGTFLRPGEAIEDVFLRLEYKEKVGKFLNKKFVGFENNPYEERGHIIQLIFLCDIKPSVGSKGVWFSVNNLPTEEMVKNHFEVLIPRVLSEAKG